MRFIYTQLLFFSFFILHAQNIDDQKELNDSLLLDEVELKAKKIFKTDVNHSFNIDKEKLASIPQLDQFLNKTPGIEMQIGALNTNRINVRGIGSRSPFATSKLKAYIDDIPLTDGAGETSLEDINLNIIDDIELIKGPNSSIYGGTLGGVILFKTRNQLFDYPKSSLSLDLGSYGLKRLNTDFFKKWRDNKNSTFINAEYIEAQGYRENNEYEKFSSSLVHNIIGKDSYWTILLNFINLRSEIPSSISLDDYLNNPRSAAFNWASVEGYEDNLKLRIGLNYNKYITESSSLIASVFGSFYNAYEFRPFNVLDDDSRLIGLRSRYIYDKNRLTITLGTELSTELYQWKILESINKNQGDLLQENKSIRTQYQFFNQAQYKLKDNLLLFGGFNINSAFFNIDYKILNETTEKAYDWYFMPRIGLEYTGADQNKLRFQVSKGMVFPGLDESLNPDGFFISTLSPEKGINYELTSVWNISDQLKFETTFFLMYVNDILVNRQDQNGQSFALNAGKTRHMGIEPVIDFQLYQKNEISLDISFSGNFGKYEFTEFVSQSNFNGNELTGVAANKYNISANINSPLFFFRSSLRYVGKIPVNDANSIFSDAYYVQRVLLGKRIKISSNAIEASFSIDNLWNVKYASMISVNPPSFGANPPRVYYPGMPRNYMFGLKYIFQ